MFSPEGAMMMEKIGRPPRVAQNRHWRIIGYNDDCCFDRCEFFNFLDDQALSDTESEEEEDNLGLPIPKYRYDSLNLSVGSDDATDVFINRLQYDYHGKLFKAAIGTFNVDRVRDLIAKKKHLILEPYEKMTVFKDALIALSCVKADEIYEILKIFLKNGFYPRDEELKKGLNVGGYGYNFMIHIIKDPRAAGVFLEYDPDFFRNQVSTANNLVAEAVDGRDYVAANLALDYGCDPRHAANGKNVLDMALVLASRYSLNGKRENEDSRLRLIERLRSEYGMEETKASCEK